VQEEAIRTWGLVHENGKPGGGAIARPAIFLVEPDGTISWRQLTDDYRVRVRAENLLEVLRAAN
jgi:peroxiredoxin